MDFELSFFDRIWENDANFDALSIELFRYQAQHCGVYKQYIDALSLQVDLVEKVEQIPFLPISFFKTHQVTTHSFEPEIIFKSSGTTAQTRSQHLVKRKELYTRTFNTILKDFYGLHPDTIIIGLLPSYVENGDSSLVFMVDNLIQQSNDKRSGIYLNNYAALQQILIEASAEKKSILCIGVTYALLEFANQFPTALNNNCIIMETGGMKGRGEEKSREEVHQILSTAFQLQDIHSEYGMTELMSQAYSKQSGIFKNGKSMKVLVRDFYDPFDIKTQGRGIANIIDLANIHSCAFIATQDIADIEADGSFAILGRQDHAEIRGCNMLG
jgi:hypothetical protein